MVKKLFGKTPLYRGGIYEVRDGGNPGVHSKVKVREVRFSELDGCIEVGCSGQKVDNDPSGTYDEDGYVLAVHCWCQPMSLR